MPVVAIKESNSIPSTSTLISEYTASFSWDGKLEETYKYHVTSLDNYTMLYRSFDVPLVTKYLPNPHIELISMNAPDGTVAYMKDTTGTVSFPNGIRDTNSISNIKSKSEDNEVGIYREGGFEPGIYPVVYNFRFYPTLEYDQSTVHLNIMLAYQHPAYGQIKIIVPEKSVREIFFSPSDLTVTKNTGNIIASGSVAENEVIGFEVILDKDALETLSGFPVYTEDVTGRTKAARYSNTVGAQSEPGVYQSPPQSSSGNGLIDWFIKILYPLTNLLSPSSPEPTIQPIQPYRPAPTLYPAPSIAIKPYQPPSRF
jgi:hypothetical protein